MSTKKDRKTLDRLSKNNKNIDKKKYKNFIKSRRKNTKKSVPSNHLFIPTTDQEGTFISSSSSKRHIVRKLSKKEKI